MIHEAPLNIQMAQINSEKNTTTKKKKKTMHERRRTISSCFRSNPNVCIIGVCNIWYVHEMK